MPRFIAFLRAINVGGRTVKMDRLRTLFTDAGFRGAETLIASGNVIFESRSGDTTALERKIEGVLRQGLGYEVATFVRTPADLTAIVDHERLRDATGTSLYVAFTRAAPSDEVKAKVDAFRSETDDFVIEGREIYWISRTTMSQSPFSAALLEKTLGMPATRRNVTTVRKLAEKYASR